MTDHPEFRALLQEHVQLVERVHALDADLSRMGARLAELERGGHPGGEEQRAHVRANPVRRPDHEGTPRGNSAASIGPDAPTHDAAEGAGKPETVEGFALVASWPDTGEVMAFGPYATHADAMGARAKRKGQLGAMVAGSVWSVEPWGHFAVPLEPPEAESRMATEVRELAKKHAIKAKGEPKLPLA